MAKSHQLQWRTRDPIGGWKFHSVVDETQGADQIAAAKASPHTSFDYRMVPKDSPQALAPKAESIYAGRMETLPGVFPGGRSAA